MAQEREKEMYNRAFQHKKISKTFNLMKSIPQSSYCDLHSNKNNGKTCHYKQMTHRSQ